MLHYEDLRNTVEIINSYTVIRKTFQRPLKLRVQKRKPGRMTGGTNNFPPQFTPGLTLPCEMGCPVQGGHHWGPPSNSPPRSGRSAPSEAPQKRGRKHLEKEKTKGAFQSNVAFITGRVFSITSAPGRWGPN